MDKNQEKAILIVEDEISLLHALQDAFERGGFLVLTAKDGKEGLNIALTRHPDFILLDILMPNMNGVEMLSKLRNNPWGYNAQVSMLTNIIDTKHILDAKDLRVNAYIIKSDREIEDVVKDVKLILKM